MNSTDYSLPGQLSATKHLCHLYGCESPDRGQCIIYSQHQVQLLRRLEDKGQEGDALEAISQLYLTLGTERCVCECVWSWNVQNFPLLKMTNYSVF